MRLMEERQEVKSAIINSLGAPEVGHIWLTIYRDQASLQGRFAPFLSRIPFGWDYPFGVFEDLHVHENQRRKGYGQLGLRIADDQFQRSGVKIGILKVGWGISENWEEAKAWKTAFYAKAGWLSLHWTSPEPVLMAKNYQFKTS